MPSATAEKKRKPGRPAGKVSDRDDITAKVDRALVDMARAVALDEKIPIAQILSECAADPLRRRYEAVIRKKYAAIQGTSARR
jgi:hypothetical protein